MKKLIEHGDAELAVATDEVVLAAATSPEWVAAVRSDLGAFLRDHASCERKASSMAMSFVSHYPDRRELVGPMIRLAEEELHHFYLVYKLIDARGLRLEKDIKDPYVNELLTHMRQGRDAYLLDRLLIAAVVEARGCERFGLLGESLQGELGQFYRTLARAERNHASLFLRLARTYFDEATVEPRLTELLQAEAGIMRRQPFRSALH